VFYAIGSKSQVIAMKRKTYALATEEDLLIDLTFHKVSASLAAEFKEKILDPHYNGNFNAAFQNLFCKAL